MRASRAPAAERPERQEYLGRPRRTHGRRGTAAPPDDGGAGDRWLHELGAIARDPSRWPELDEDTLLLIVFQQCLFWAHTRDEDAAAALAELYPYVAGRAPAGARFELLDRVSSAVEEGHAPVLALLPFLQHEPEPAAVALAGTAFATLAPIEGGDDASGPRALVHMAEHAEDPGTQAGLVAAVLQLGDRRFLPLVHEGWSRLGPEARVRFAELRAVSPMLFTATIEFWLDALADADEPTAAAIAAALERLPAEAEPKRVLDVRRKLPAHAPDDREEIAIVDDVPLAAYAARIAPRLRELAQRPGASARAGAVLAAWGVGEAPDA